MDELLTDYRNWSLRQTFGDPLPEHQLADMLAEARKHGPTNNWTGTAGTLAAMVVELLREVERMRATR